MTPVIEELLWRPERLREGLQGFSVEVGFPIRDVVLPKVENRPEWLEEACAFLGLEVETAFAFGRELPSALETVAPGAVLFLADLRVLLVVQSSRRALVVLAPDGRRVAIPVAQCAAQLRARYETRVEVPDFLRDIPEAAGVYDRVVATRRSDAAPLCAVLPMRVATSRSLRDELAQSSFVSRGFLALLLLAVQSSIAIVATILLGTSIAEGRVDSGRILGWGLALATQVVLQGLLGIVVGHLNIELATVLKRRLVDGAFSLDPDVVKREGVGANLSIAAESSVIDQLSISDITDAISGFLLFFTCAAYLATEPVALAGLAAVTLVAAVLLIQFFKLSSSLTARRIKLTDIFVERVLGHHTRLVQLPRGKWHEGEDENLHAYTAQANVLDRIQTYLGVLPRAWLIFVVAAALRNVAQDGTSPLQLGGLVAGYAAMQAFSQVVRSILRLLRWPVSFRTLLPILSRATNSEDFRTTKLQTLAVDEGDVLLEASGLRFAYAPLRPTVLDGLDLRIHAGDQMLVTGPSGGGKSTLASLLTALRKPLSGIVLLRGLDQHSVSGSEWRKHVVSAPQFHENYIFQNTLAFNVLMGRRWPALPPDLQLAEQICRELGLGPLLDAMPAGLQQVVGETGWRLSHGERSRVFIARALLQNADVFIFDESFGALDPETLDLAMETVRRRARTLLVISHK